MKKTSAGFTLVELIVVIAILGILAGISVPVYSGYIKKAHEAADSQLLSAVNTAFGAACLENGVDAARQPDYYASVSLSEGRVTGVTKWNDDFLRYYAGNEDAAFSVYTALWFRDGVFAPAAGETTVTLSNGSTLTVDNAALASFLGGSFVNLDSAETQAESINRLTGSIDTLVSQALAANPGFFEDDAFNEFLSGLGIEGPLTNTEKANALVLYAAANADKIDTAGLLSAMSAGGTLSLSDTDKSAVIGNASAAYALMYGFANSGAEITTTTPGRDYQIKPGLNGVPDGITTSSSQEELNAWLTEQGNNYPAGTTIDIETTPRGKLGIMIHEPGTSSTQSASDIFSNYNLTGIDSVKELYNQFAQSNSFQQYVAANGANDMNAFIGALELVNDNVGSENVSNILSKGWTEGGIADMLSAVLGG